VSRADEAGPGSSAADDAFAPPAAAPEAACPLCREVGGELLWRDTLCRVVRVDDADYPGFCRVILERHTAEMSDLRPGERAALMATVFAVEAALRQVLAPDKINLASLGNLVPHLHWHVIPRWRADRHFPQPIWGSAQRPGQPPALDAQAVATAVRAHCAALAAG
jgi:diadenosine tetraphosphate (Ap4A) HIT family hydrolase